ncbi:uncharacterized protein PV09_00511 [Verruconis gallopava]|uniref:Uncharacterized protein n=1 Tax=Verruconis gallopava TaxID=253628 RepID=A0A0D2APE3_9PEZI|nr:uncharacterized protein PV09_00511 [Verruconis gallopava]KIW08543.1 hypothetical protein PV09_00511 [Verruconis gallopava]
MTSLGSRSFAPHGKIHKRAGSASSSLQSPTLPPALENFPSDYKSTPEFRPVRYTDEQWEVQPKVAANKIKPYLRKLSSKDENRIDLSRTTEENERIAGLGIGADFNTLVSRSVSEVSFTPVNSRSRHGRTTSNGSTFSTSSGLQRSTAPYSHTLRHTPRPYTPPVTKSYATSAVSDGVDEPTDLVGADGLRPRFYSDSHHNRSGSHGSLPAYPAPLRLHTSSSFTRLNTSQSSIPSSGAPNSARPRGDTLRSIDTVGSPSSRTSFDKAVSFLRRGQSIDELDAAAARAASIRALRAAYNEKEEAKEAKYRAKQERQRRKSDAAAASSSSTPAGPNEKREFVGKAYDEYSATHASSQPRTEKRSARPRLAMVASAGSGSKRGVKSTWLRFLAWLRTRLLRLSGRRHRR